LGYSKSVAGLLTNLCCFNKSLPQGAPTSPALSNLIFKHADNRISGFAMKLGIRYTRYSDDITFSGNIKTGQIIKFVRKVLNEEGLSLNYSKIRLMQTHQRQEVTGITVNNKLQAPRFLRRKLRQQFYYINKFGLASHLDKTHNLSTNYIYRLLGISNFILFINPVLS